MTDEKTWLITGAGRGMGVEFAKAALGAGYKSSLPPADRLDLDLPAQPQKPFA